MQEPVVPMSFMRAKPIGVMGMIDQVGFMGCLRLPSMGTVWLAVFGSPSCAAEDAESWYLPVAMPHCCPI